MTARTRVGTFQREGVNIPRTFHGGSYAGQNVSEVLSVSPIDDSIVVIEANGSFIRRYDANGNYTARYGGTGYGGNIWGVTHDLAGNVIIAYTSYNAGLTQFYIELEKLSGDLSQWLFYSGSHGESGGGLNWYAGTATRVQNYLFVANVTMTRIEVFLADTLQWAFSFGDAQFGTYGDPVYYPWYLYASADHVYAWGGEAGETIYKWTPLGVLVDTLTINTTNDVFAVSPDNELFVSNDTNEAVQHFLEDGTPGDIIFDYPSSSGKYFIPFWHAGAVGILPTLVETEAPWTWDFYAQDEVEDWFLVDRYYGPVFVGATPGQVAVSPTTGKVFIADAANGRLLRYDAEGSLEAYVAASSITGVACDASGDVWAVRAGTLYKYNPATLAVVNSRSIGTSTNKDVTVDGTYWYVTSQASDRIQRGTLASTTAGVSFIPTTVVGQYTLNNPWGIAHDGTYLYVTDANNRVLKFNKATGGFVSSWGSLGSGLTQFNSPRSVVIASNGTVIVADSGNNRVSRFTETGTHVGIDIATTGPSGMGITADDDLVIYSTAANRLYRYSGLSAESRDETLGFQPKGMLTVLTSGDGAPSEDWARHGELVVGLSAPSSEGGPLVTRSMALYSPDATATPRTSVRAYDGVIELDDDGIVYRSETISLLSNGFSLTWDRGIREGRGMYFAFGEEADARSWGDPDVELFNNSDPVGTTGTILLPDADFPVTGVWICSVATDNQSGCFGVAAKSYGDAISQWGEGVGGSLAETPSQAAMVFSDDCAIVILDEDGVIRFRARVVAMDPGECTLQIVENTLSSGMGVRVFGLMVGGADMEAGSFYKTLNSAPTTQIISVAEQASAVMVMGDTGTIFDNSRSDIRVSMGFASFFPTETNAAAAVVIRDALPTTDAQSLLSDLYAYVSAQGSPPSGLDRATLDASIGQLEFDWSANTANAFRTGWFAMYRAVTALASTTGGGVTVTVQDTNLPMGHDLQDAEEGFIAISGLPAALTLDWEGMLAPVSPPQVRVLGPTADMGGAHALSGAAHVQIDTWTRRAHFQESHELFGNAELTVGHKDQREFLGDEFIQTHMLYGTATVEVSTPDDIPLRMDWTEFFTAAASMRVIANMTWPSMPHPLESLDNSVEVLGPPVYLGGDAGPLIANIDDDGLAASVEVFTTASLAASAGLRGAGLIDIQANSARLAGAPIPEPQTLKTGDLVGTVNLFQNPSFELDTSRTEPLNGATVTQVEVGQNLAWHGTGVLNVELPNAAEAGVVLESIGGLPYRDRPYGFLSQFHIKCPSGTIPEEMQAFTRIHYYDGTHDTGPSLQWFDTQSSRWDRKYVPVAVQDPAKEVERVDLHIRREVPVPGQTFQVDGVQIELDRGHGHTIVAIGSFGAPYHRWDDGGAPATATATGGIGPAHRSLSIREPIPMDYATPKRTGEYRMEAWLYKTNADGTILEDLSKWVINCEVTMDTERDVSWTMTAEMLGDGYRRITPFEHWLKPYMRVTYPNGVVREGQIGHFVVVPSMKEIEEFSEIVTVDGRSAEFLLKLQGTPGYMFVRENVNLARAAKVVLNASHVGGRKGGPRYSIPDRGTRAHRDMTWEKKEDSLTIVNDLLKKAHLSSLYQTKNGVLTAVSRRDRRWRRVEPVRTFASFNNPGKSDPWVARAIEGASDVIGTIKVTPNLGNISENKIVIVSVNPRKHRIRVVRHIADNDHPNGPRKRHRSHERKIKMDIGSQADAEALAHELLEEIGTDIDVIELAVIPDPATDFSKQTVYCSLYDNKQRPIAVGKYKVRNIVYGFTDDEAMMRMSLGFIHKVDYVTTYDPRGIEYEGEFGVR